MLRRALLAGLAAVPALGAARAATLDLQLTGTRRGVPVIVALCQGGLADRYCRIVWRAERPEGEAEGHVLEVPPGRYAVVAFEDANRNGRLDTVLGLPVERYGLSNDIGRFAPPVFERAAVAVQDKGTRVLVRLARLGQPG